MVLLHPELANELLTMNRRMNAGMRREEALHGLFERTGVDELRSLGSNMIQSERWGTSIAQGAARLLGVAAPQATSGGREESGGGGDEDGVPVGVVHSSRVVRGHRRPGGHRDRPGLRGDGPVRSGAIMQRLEIKLSNRKGFTLILSALLIFVFIGAAVMAVDVGHMQVRRADVHAASDAAALAAMEEFTSQTGGMRRQRASSRRSAFAATIQGG